MMGKIIAVFIVVVSLAAGAGLYYSQVYGYYDTVTPTPGRDVTLVANASGLPEPIAYDNFQAIDAQSSPIRFRACWTAARRFGITRRIQRSEPERHGRRRYSRRP